MPFIVCDECGTQNERPSAPQTAGGAGDSYVYCRACANRIDLRASTENPTAGAAASGSSSSSELLDELLSLPLAEPHHRAHEATPAAAPEEAPTIAAAPEPAPTAAPSEAPPEAAPIEPTVVVAVPELTAAPDLQRAAKPEGPVPEPSIIAKAPPKPQAAGGTTRAGTAEEKSLLEQAAAALQPRAAEAPASATVGPTAPAVSKDFAGLSRLAATVPRATAAVPRAAVPLARTPVSPRPVATAPVATAPVATAPIATAPIATAPIAPHPVAVPPLAAPDVATAPMPANPASAAPSSTAAAASTLVATPFSDIAIAVAPAAAAPLSLKASIPFATAPVATVPISHLLDGPLPPAPAADVPAAPVALDAPLLPETSAPAEVSPAAVPLGGTSVSSIGSETPAIVQESLPASADVPLGTASGPESAGQIRGLPTVSVAAAAPRSDSSEELSWDLSPPPANAADVATHSARAMDPAPLPIAEGSSPHARPDEQLIRELPRVEFAASPANIRATLPFGPTLPLPGEPIPGIVVEETSAGELPQTSLANTSDLAPADSLSANEETTPTAMIDPSSVWAPASSSGPVVELGPDHSEQLVGDAEARLQPRTPVGVPATVEATPQPARLPVAKNPWSTSDAPTTQSWTPPAPEPSALRRFAPLGAALAAVVVAFIGGVQFGKMGTSAGVQRAESARAVAAVRPAAAEPSPPSAAAAAPAPTPASPAASASLESAPNLPNGKPARPAGKFSAKVANAALAQATGRVRACRKGGVAGTGTAAVTFGASGRVEDVTVSGARLAGTPTATCVASALSTVRIAPFTGNAQTVKRAIKLD